MATKERAPSYSRVACIGAGLAGIALGVQLKRWYNLDDIQLFERNDDLGGTWYVNSYPGMHSLPTDRCQTRADRKPLLVE